MANIDELLKDLPEDKVNEIKSHLNENYVGRNVAHEDTELINKVWGKKKGSYETQLKRNLKAVSEDLLSPKEIEELGFDKALDTAFEKIARLKQSLEEKAKGNGNPTKEFEELKSKYEKLNGDFLQIKTQRDEFEGLVSKKDEEFSSFKKNLAINSKKREALKNIAFTDNLQGPARDFALQGFNDSFNSKYSIELSDEDESGIVIRNKQGQRVSKDNKFLSLEELYKQEAHAAGLLKLNNNSNKKIKFETSKKSDGSHVNENTGLKFKGKM